MWTVLTSAFYAFVSAVFPLLVFLYLYDFEGPQVPLLNSWSIRVYGFYIASLILLKTVLPGRYVQGLPTPQKRVLSYYVNGFSAFVTFTVGAIILEMMFPYFQQLSSNVLPLFTVSLTVSIILAFALLLFSFRSGVELAPACSLNVAEGFWMGRELNPRIGTFDIKYFLELYTGLLLWHLLNMAALYSIWLDSSNMWDVLPALLVTLSQGLYVADGLYFDDAVLSTMDITEEGLGFMLVFGNLGWLPFVYSVQTRVLTESPAISPMLLAIGTLLCILGYLVFRLSNLEKHRFRQGKRPDLQVMRTERGRDLIVSGFFGSARKINYTGDFLLCLGQTLLSGFSSVRPWLFMVYMTILLAHRALRDDSACAKKYGKDWEAYKAKVPYVFIPYVV